MRTATGASTAIRVEKLGKRYRIGEKQQRHDTLRDAVVDFGARLAKVGRRNPSCRSQSPDSSHIWALKDVSFEVKHGEVLGIIGRNGAGKSTLLKVLSRITEPSEGHAEIRGRVGSLLEVGTGFHPELTGRENIYLNGAILGMRKAEIDRKFDEIVDFAEIERFIDTPVKRYSSGMYVRLAFAVAAHMEPEILLVDEVLAVGDFAFQKKCLGKMQQVSGLGRTVLFVSHNLTAVKSLCQSCLLLESGSLTYLGKPDDCIDRYLAGGDGEGAVEVDVEPRERIDTLGNGLRFTRVRLCSSSGVATLALKEPLVLQVRFRVLEPLSDAVLGFSVYSFDQVQVLQCLSTRNGQPPMRHLVPGDYLVTCTLLDNPLAPGRYVVELGARDDRRQQDEVPHALQFEILETEVYESPWIAPVRGYLRVSSRWSEPECLGA